MKILAKLILTVLILMMMTSQEDANADQFSEAANALKSGNYSKAIQICDSLAEQGDANAQGLLGTMYLEGRGVAKNDAEAVKWLHLAAKQGHPVAQVTLGTMYLEGRGVAKNDAEAVKWFQLSAEQGYANAQFNLGFVYGNGRGVPENHAEAMKWYRLAAEQGNADAKVGYRYHLRKRSILVRLAATIGLIWTPALT